ncbi:membrane transporter [Sugiyamaella lignohabitans]|uniref:Membrane transporter n=1 Tax=Sugiyamaella lignohabitans TaxID=796027 RepID=A0A167CTU0_9ASCO|nr:membrane transporter [Sugiyamaella lignohabitans]ANB12096.1 membrane transporter [Sugiyamaella lignohabitans]
MPFAFQTRLGIAEDQVQTWVSTSLAIYAAGVIVGSLVVGAISDKLGQRRAFMISGFVVMEGATCMLCFPKSLALYMVGRTLQGVSAAIAWGIGFAIISDSAEPDQVALLMSYPSMGLSLGIFLGPLLGGVMYDRAGYYSVFYLCFGVFGLDILVRFLMTEKSTLEQKLKKYELYEKKRQEAFGEIMMTTTSHSGSINPGHASQSESTMSSDSTIEQSEEEERQNFSLRHSFRKMTLIQLLQSPRVLNNLFLTFILVWFSGNLDATMTIHLADIFNFNSLYSGLMFLAIVAPMVLEPVCGYVSDKYGGRYLVTAGFIWICPSLMLMWIPHENTTGHIVMFIAFLVMVGIGFTLVFTPLMAEMTNAVNEIDRANPGTLGGGKGFAQAYGLVNIASSLGQIVGPYQGGAVMSRYGWGINVLIMGLLALVAAVPGFLLTGGKEPPSHSSNSLTPENSDPQIPLQSESIDD